jgi:hypothetical protein
MHLGIKMQLQLLDAKMEQAVHLSLNSISLSEYRSPATTFCTLVIEIIIAL